MSTPTDPEILTEEEADRQVDDLVFRGLLSPGSESGSGKLTVSSAGAAFLDTEQ